MPWDTALLVVGLPAHHMALLLRPPGHIADAASASAVGSVAAGMLQAALEGAGEFAIAPLEQALSRT